MYALLFLKYVWISRKTKISFKIGPNLKKTYWSMMIMHIIFDLMGDDLQNWFMTYLWLELRWNTCMCEIYTPLRGFPLFECIQCFLWCSLETKFKLILISFLVLWISSLCFHFSLLHFEKFCSDQFRDWFFKKHVHSFFEVCIIYT